MVCHRNFGLAKNWPGHAGDQNFRNIGLGGPFFPGNFGPSLA